MMLRVAHVSELARRACALVSRLTSPLATIIDVPSFVELFAFNRSLASVQAMLLA